MRLLMFLILSSVMLINCSTSPSAPVVVSSTPGPIAEVPKKDVYAGGGVKRLKELSGRTVREIELWDSKDMDERLAKLLGDAYPAMKKTWLVESPIKVEGDILMMAGCGAEDCPNSQYVMLVDASRDNLNVQHFGNGKMKVYEEKGAISIPETFASEMAVMRKKSGVK